MGDRVPNKIRCKKCAWFMRFGYIRYGYCVYHNGLAPKNFQSPLCFKERKK